MASARGVSVLSTRGQIVSGHPIASRTAEASATAGAPLNAPLPAGHAPHQPRSINCTGRASLAAQRLTRSCFEIPPTQGTLIASPRRCLGTRAHSIRIEASRGGRAVVSIAKPRTLRAPAGHALAHCPQPRQPSAMITDISVKLTAPAGQASMHAEHAESADFSLKHEAATRFFSAPPIPEREPAPFVLARESLSSNQLTQRFRRPNGRQLKRSFSKDRTSARNVRITGRRTGMIDAWSRRAGRRSRQCVTRR